MGQESAYRRLSTPAILPLARVSEPWQPLPFDVGAPSLNPAVGAAGEIALRGVLLRVPTAGDAPELKAFCLTCPHEICQVDYQEDTSHVCIESGSKPDNPLFVCPCHFSVFDPRSDAARISGPAPRGLYRFRFQVEADEVRIDEVEEEALR